MASNQKSKAPAKVVTGDNRASGKARKKNPKKNGAGTTGRTIGGYTPAKIASRAYKRQHGHDAIA